jgi:hypothetical protein
MLMSEDEQVSLTDPDSRSMATSGRGSGVVGYNVQTVVETKNHLIITDDVTNTGSDRGQLARLGKASQRSCAPTSWRPSWTAATSTALRSWSATTLASR